MMINTQALVKDLEKAIRYIKRQKQILDYESSSIGKQTFIEILSEFEIKST